MIRNLYGPAERLYAKYRERTMCVEPIFRANLELAWHHRTVQGAIVECGTWRGGMIGAIADYMGDKRHYVLADSFQGLPPAQPIDGQAALDWQHADPNNCRATADEARESMRMAGVQNYTVARGWFESTLPLIREPIALLRLDADWYESTMCCLNNLFVSVVPGGLIIIDDYYVWDGCARAVHHFLDRDQCIERIREHDGVAYMVRAG